MKCEKCKYYNIDEQICGAFPQCTGQDCGDLLPCEQERRERRRAIVARSQRKRRAIAVACGLCSICAVRPARIGRKTCGECCARIAAANKKKKSPE